MSIVPKENKSTAITLLSKQRKGDPLGINRPYIEPPEDPEKYDESIEKQEFALSLLPVDLIKAREEDIRIGKEFYKSGKINEKTKIKYNEDGFYHIDSVRDIMKSELSKESLYPDPEFMIYIDTNINYKIFIADNTVYTRKELFENYAFTELEAIPEDFFSRQLIGVFENSSTNVQYIRKDEDDESMDFVQLECLFRQKKDANYVPIKPTRVVRTKIFIGGDAFESFVDLQKQMRTIITMRKRHSQTPGTGNLLTAILGNTTAMRNVLALTYNSNLETNDQNVLKLPPNSETEKQNSNND